MKMVLDENGNAQPAIDISAGVSCSFTVSALSIIGPLAGAIHRFTVKKTPVEVRLPKAPPRKSIGSIGDEHEPIFCYTWRSKTNTALEYLVREVGVFVDLQRQVRVPKAALTRMNPGFHSVTDRQRLEGILQEGNAIAAEAFSVWLRALRWKSLNAGIGQTELVRTEQRRQYLADSATRQRFFSGPIVITARGFVPVTRRVWNSCQGALQKSESAPLWLEFLFEGQHRVSSGDLHGGIVCLAVSCELLIRVLVMRPTNRRFVPLLRRMKAMNILDQWDNIGPSSKRVSQAMNREKLKRLLHLRNGIMHSGDVHALTTAECRELAEVARKFVVSGTVLGERLSLL